MKSKLLLVTVLVFTIFKITLSQIPSLQFLKSVSGFDNEFGNDLCVDTSGNIYIAGSSTSHNFYIGNQQYTNPPGLYTSSLFIAKYNSTGNVVWSKNIPGTNGGYIAANSITVDNNGNVYVLGTFAAPSITIGNFVLNNNGSSDVFVTKISTSGNVIWAKEYGGVSTEYATDITIHNNNEIIITGGTQSDSMQMDNTLLVSPNVGCGEDAFVAKLDLSGNTMWGKRIGGYGGDEPHAITNDLLGNIYVVIETQTDSFQAITINANNVFLKGFEGTYLVKLNSNGQLVWAKKAGTTFYDKFNDVCVDKHCNVFVTGDYYNTAIQFGTIQLLSRGNKDAFLVKYDSLGTEVWAKPLGGTNDDIGQALHADVNDNIYIAGNSSSSTLLLANDTILNRGGIFITKIDPSGNPIYTKSGFGNAVCQHANCNAIVSDNNSNLYAIGETTYKTFTIENDSLNNADTTTISCYMDLFLAKFSLKLTGIIDNNPQNNELIVYPNPSNSIINIEINHGTKENYTLQLFSIDGKEILSKHTDLYTTYQLDLSSVANGIYFLQMQSNQKHLSKKIIVQKYD